MTAKSTATTYPLYDDQLVDEKTFSQIVDRPISTLRKDRMAGRGFPFIKLGRSVKYSLSDARKEIARCRRSSTTDDGVTA